MLAFAYLAIIAISTAVMGTVLLFRRISLMIQGVRVKGDFVRWQAHGLRKTYHYPVIRFIDCEGKEHEFVGGPGSTRKNARSRYRVVYPPGEPGRAMTLSFSGYWAAPLVFLVISGVSAFAAFQHLPE